MKTDEPRGRYDAETQEVFTVPHPLEIINRQTSNGGWTRHDLSLWGVPFPPPKGWKEELEKAYSNGFTLGVILECVWCRRAVFFVDPIANPVCLSCFQKHENKRGNKIAANKRRADVGYISGWRGERRSQNRQSEKHSMKTDEPRGRYDVVEFMSSNEWKICTNCGEVDFVPSVDENTLCYNCLGIGFPKHKNKVSYKKKQIPQGFRWEVFLRDGFACRECGSQRSLTVDHIHPESKGGELTIENSQTLCRSCNSKKGAR